MSGKPLLRVLTHATFAGLCVFAAWAGRRERAELPSEALAFHLRESAHERGIDFRHANCALDPKLDNIAVQIAALGASVAVCDANGDGWPDFYTTTSAFGRPNALYVNDGHGQFRDVAASANAADMNAQGVGASMGTIWADADGDGDQDCYLYRYGYPTLLRNDGALHFTDVTETSGLKKWRNANAAAWIDYDRDGLVDLCVGGYFRDDVDLWNLKTTRIMQDSFEFSANGGTKGLYKNLGGLRFEDVGARTGFESTRWTLAIAAADLDGDGWQDLYLANDYGPEELFWNRGGQRFERAHGIGLEESSKSGMSVALGDIQNDGKLALYITNISKAGYLFQGNNLRLNRLTSSGGFLQNVAEGPSEDCGWSWGSQFGDFDNDGRVDLVVLNGFVSASKERDYWYAMNKLASAQGSLAEDAAAWPPQGDASLSGYERSSLLLNVSPETGARRVKFTDVAEAAGMTDLDDGRAIACADFERRGKLDLVIANQQGPLLYYANEVDPARHWIRFELRGARGNTSAIGAQVTLEAGDWRTTNVVLAGSGFSSQNDLALHFGLGARTHVDRAVIRWTSGLEQVIEAPAIDRGHALVEPAP